MYTENSLGTISCQCSVATLAHLVSNHAPHQQNAYDNQSIYLLEIFHNKNGVVTLI